MKLSKWTLNYLFQLNEMKKRTNAKANDDHTGWTMNVTKCVKSQVTEREIEKEERKG